MKKTTITPEHFLLWIDGAGCYRVIRGNLLTIGGPTSQKKIDSHHLSILAELDRIHVRLERGVAGSVLVSSGKTRVDETSIQGSIKLGVKNQMRLGDKVELQWKVPHILSQTAVIDFVSHHRPKQRVDGVIWMDQFLALGTKGSVHIRCPDMSGNCYLYFHRNELRIKTEQGSDEKLEPGMVFTSEQLQFRYEQLT